MSNVASKSVIARNTLWSVVGYAVQFVTPIVLVPYTVSRVTVDQYGLWVNLLTLANWFGVPTTDLPTIFPNLANYMVLNVGLTEKQLPLIYLSGGLCTVFTMNWIGRWADLAGKPKVFTIMSLCSLLPILLVTNLQRVPLVEAISVSTLLMICMSGRFVPAMAMMTGSVEARFRGGFMSINSSVQQLACGLAALVSGHLLGQGPGGEITHFSLTGVLSVGCALASIYLARFLKPGDRTEGPIAAVPAEG